LTATEAVLSGRPAVHLGVVSRGASMYVHKHLARVTATLHKHETWREMLSRRSFWACVVGMFVVVTCMLWAISRMGRVSFHPCIYFVMLVRMDCWHWQVAKHCKVTRLLLVSQMDPCIRCPSFPAVVQYFSISNFKYH